MESDLSTRTMGTDLPSPLVERRSVCGYHAWRICGAGRSRLCDARRIAATGWHLWLLAGRVGLRIIWILPPLGDWADFRDLAYGWGFRRAPGHGRSGPVCSDCDSFSICSGRYVHLRMAIATEYSHLLHQPMKLPNLSAAVLAMMGLASTSLAADFTDWVAKGYRWSVVSGPYAYIMKENAKNEGSRFARKSANETIGRAYYMRPGKVVLVVETDAASGLSKIRMGGIASDLWTPTKNLSTRPVRNALGEIETPDMASILPILEATPSPGSSAKPAASARPSPTAAPSK